MLTKTPPLPRRIGIDQRKRAKACDPNQRAWRSHSAFLASLPWIEPTSLLSAAHPPDHRSPIARKPKLFKRRARCARFCRCYGRLASGLLGFLKTQYDMPFRPRPSLAHPSSRRTGAVDLLEMPLDLPHRHAARVHRDEAGEAALAFLDKLHIRLRHKLAPSSAYAQNTNLLTGSWLKANWPPLPSDGKLDYFPAQNSIKLALG
jgi:hypothetical protein